MHLDIRAGHKTDIATIKCDGYGCNLLDGKLPAKLCEGIYDLCIIQQNTFTNTNTNTNTNTKILKYNQ